MTGYWLSGIAGLALGGVLAGGVQQLRVNAADLRATAITTQAANEKTAAATAYAQQVTANQDKLDAALKTFATTQQRNAQAQASLERSLRTLSGTTVGLRSELARVPDRLATATQSAAADFAAACSTVLSSMASRGEQMAGRGAAIAKAADAHAADAKRLEDAWPR